ncbi:MAG: ABC transporter ATP-binding protein [Helicobacteraceae bacterium]|jgi:putative ABC transport system ATP-binding protein|nr:ABC transporter ATP-binding protein [Helicobacteraceae bacterium]
MNKSTTLLKAENIAHSFEYPLFREVCLEIKGGESLAVLGVSGSGKSTLLHILSSFLKPLSGRAEAFGRDIYALKPAELAKLRRETIGLIFQQHYLFRGFSARENLQVAALLRETQIDLTLLDSLGISHILDQDSASLSGGQQQRLSIARVLTKKPKLLFADEPTGNLDRKTASEAADILFDYARDNQCAFFIVTHDEALAKKADRRYRLENGALIEQ